MYLDYDSLPQEHPQKFIKGNVDLADWSQVEPYFAELQSRDLSSPAVLEGWFDDYSELLVAVSEQGTVRYIRMTEQTTNEDFRSAYLSFVENVEPKVKIAQFNLYRKYAGSDQRKNLPREKYTLADLRIENSVRLFREENVNLEKDERALSQRYQEITGEMTVSYDGKDRTMQQMQKYAELPERGMRREAWTLVQKRMLQDRDRLDQIYDRMVILRQDIAKNAGFGNFRDYVFLKRERFDYTPDDCFRFHEAVERHIVPLVREVYRKRKEMLKVDQLRPWDIIADPEGRPPLHPFETTAEFVQGCRRVFEKVDRELAENFQRTASLNLLDLESRPGKAPGGYNAELSRVRLPFIFMNAVGRDDDVRILLHESGHAFQVYEMKHKDLNYLYKADNLPVEIAEVASMSMEFMGGEHLEGVFYDRKDAMRSSYDHNLQVARLLPWIATIDAFQHWVYTHPGHSRDERRDAWVRTHERFSVGESWEGLEEERRSFWHKQLHLFEIPFYYIEYGIAQLGALGIWVRYLKEPKEAVAAYRAALALGGSKPLPELFNTAGLPWDFGPNIVEAYSRQLRSILL
jgi:oligoendopeptidase F